MKKVIFAGKECYVCDNPGAEYLLIQPIDEHVLKASQEGVCDTVNKYLSVCTTSRQDDMETERTGLLRLPKRQ